MYDSENVGEMEVEKEGKSFKMDAIRVILGTNQQHGLASIEASLETESRMDC